MTSLAMLLAAANPVVSMFPQNVTFHAGFDDGTVEAAVGMTPDHSRSWKNYALCEGLFGKGLSRGQVGYSQNQEQPLIDGDRPGTVVLWVRLNREQEPEIRGSRISRWEGGNTYFGVSGTNGTRLLVMKSADTRWNEGMACLYVCRQDDFGKLSTRMVSARLSYADWETGTWRMIAAAWTADKLYVSVDGKPFAERPYDFSLGKLAGSVCVKTSYWDEKRDRNATSLSSSTIDEVTVFNRKLTNAEIDSIYENTKNAALSHSVGAARFADAAQLLFGGGEPLHGCGANGIIHLEPRK